MYAEPILSRQFWSTFITFLSLSQKNLFNLLIFPIGTVQHFCISHRVWNHTAKTLVRTNFSLVQSCIFIQSISWSFFCRTSVINGWNLSRGWDYSKNGPQGAPKRRRGNDEQDEDLTTQESKDGKFAERKESLSSFCLLMLASFLLFFDRWRGPYSWRDVWAKAEAWRKA